MTRRLLFSYLGIALLLLVILEVPLAVLAQRFERELATSQAEREANGLAALVNEDVENSRTSDLRSIVAGYGSRTGGELIVVGASGLVAASSKDAQSDAKDEWKALTQRADGGQSATAFTSDEGVPFAVASVPIDATDRSHGAVVLGTPATFTENRIHEIWLALGGVALGAIVVSVLGGVILARSMSRPLGRLEAAVDRLGRGDLSVRAQEDRGPPEVRSLAQQFNRMAGRLDELVEAQRRFVADASHQLRSPLTALRLRIENLEATFDGKASNGIAAVGREVHRMSRLVDGLLTLESATQDQPERGTVVVPDIIRERCEAWASFAAERGVDLIQESGPTPAATCQLVPGDLDQVLDNLLANALEVSPDGGRILVRLTGTDGRVEIHVVDEGPGMHAGDREHAFDRFWQGPERPSGHSGLGLAIVRQLALRNAMSVELRDRDGSGLDAVVQLPRSEVR